MKRFFAMLTIAAAACSPAESLAEGYTGTDGMLPQGVYFERAYSGKIGDKYSVTMKLQRNGAWVSGTYSYAGKKSSLQLHGRIDAAGNVALEEKVGLSTPTTGKWNGKFLGETFTGQWSRPDGSGTLAFLLNQTSEQALKTKREILQAAIGTYDLNGAGGATGANGMFDIARDNGRWVASSSGITDGMRQGGEIDLPEDQIKLLNSLRITVDASLKISFRAGNKLLLEIPFTELGTPYQVTPPLRDDMLDKVKGGGVYVDDNGLLYLAVLDNIEYSDAFFPGGDSSGNNDGQKIMLTLTYSPYGQEFDISVNPYGASTRMYFMKRQ